MKKERILLLLITMVFLLCACGKNEVTSQTEGAEEMVQENAEAGVAAMQEEIPEPTPEPTLEPTPEPTPVVYEGIDMESDLPGAEWMLTFEGIILEPKLVVFSDVTGKKQIVENGDVVYFNPDTDRIGVYLPEGSYATGNKARALNARKMIAHENEYVIFELEPEATREFGNAIDPAIYVEFNGKEIELPFELVLEE
ncbi:MAG: hypothetical protein IJ029_03140 [Lachnospiraceae bacterium]|nr:hypothetical protein [Lachnospiraceae bacterium]